MHITSQAISYRDGDTQLSGSLFFDESSRAARPAILVVHGGAGLDDHAKSRARGFAELGYVAFACDMYGAEVAAVGRSRIMPLILQLCAQPAKLRQRASAPTPPSTSSALTISSTQPASPPSATASAA